MQQKSGGLYVPSIHTQMLTCTVKSIPFFYQNSMKWLPKTRSAMDEKSTLSRGFLIDDDNTYHIEQPPGVY